MLKPQKGVITLCKFCGEQTGNSTKHCPNCRTQKGRKEIFDANMAIIKERQANNQPCPESLKDWK